MSLLEVKKTTSGTGQGGGDVGKSRAKVLEEKGAT